MESQTINPTFTPTAMDLTTIFVVALAVVLATFLAVAASTVEAMRLAHCVAISTEPVSETRATIREATSVDSRVETRTAELLLLFNIELMVVAATLKNASEHFNSALTAAIVTEISCSPKTTNTSFNAFSNFLTPSAILSK